MTNLGPTRVDPTTVNGPAWNQAGFAIDQAGYPYCTRTRYHRAHTAPNGQECPGLEHGEFDFGSTPEALGMDRDHAHMEPGCGGAVRPITNSHDHQED